MNADIVQVGERAPDFTIEGYNAKMGAFETYTLSSYRGEWVVLFFYPGDFTFVCPTELVVLAGFKEDLRELNARILVISADSKYVHKQWNNNELREGLGEDYPYAMLSDTTGMVGLRYNSYDADAGVHLRGTIIISPSGTVKSISVNAPELGRNPGEIVRCVQGLHEHEASGNVMPACWSPGADSIPPTGENSGIVLDLYGKNLTRYPKHS